MDASLTARVDRLEREARRWRLATLALAGAGLVATVTPHVGAQKASEGTKIKAPLTVVNEKGDKLVELYGLAGGGGGIVVSGPSGKPVILAQAKGEGGRLLVSSPSGSRGVNISGEESGGYVTLTDGARKGGIELAYTEQGAAVRLTANEDLRALLTGESAQGRLRLYGADGKPVYDSPTK